MENKFVVMEVEWISGAITTHIFTNLKVAVEALYSIRNSKVVRNIKIITAEGD